MVITHNMRTGETHCTPMTDVDREYAKQMLTRMFEVHQAKRQDNGTAAEAPNDEQ